MTSTLYARSAFGRFTNASSPAGRLDGAGGELTLKGRRTSNLSESDPKPEEPTQPTDPAPDEGDDKPEEPSAPPAN